MRLSLATLASARIVPPPYERTAPPAIVHVGVGAFARAHLAVYADDLLRAGSPATVAGASLRTERAEHQLSPQDGLFTVSAREPDGDEDVRLIGSITSVVTGTERAIAALCQPSVRLVTLTVTEQGLAEPTAANAFAGSTPSLAAVRQGAAAGGPPAIPSTRHGQGSASPPSVAAVLARALAACRAAGRRPPVVASLDNVLDNGSVLRAAVRREAERIDPALAAWIEAEVAFPSSVVDRIVPATTEADRDAVARSLGLRDEAAVVAERHRSWVIEDVEGLLPLGDVGVEVVADVAAHQRRKLWLLNGPHSALALTGLLRGHATIAEATADAAIGRFVRAMIDDVIEVADLSPAMEPGVFATSALRRFANPALGHSCIQVGADGSRKLPQRILPVAAARRRAGLPTERLATVVAIWLAAVGGAPVAGRQLPSLDDPLAVVLHATPRSRLLSRAFGDGIDRGFAVEIEAVLDRLARDGAAEIEAALGRVAREGAAVSEVPQ